VAQDDRAAVLRALACVDLVVLFEDDTPLRLIEAVQPDALAKGADYAVGDIVGREVVEGRGGLVTTIALREGLSTSAIVERIRSGRCLSPGRTPRPLGTGRARAVPARVPRGSGALAWLRDHP
jgi:hypothetical protein